MSKTYYGGKYGSPKKNSYLSICVEVFDNLLHETKKIVADIYYPLSNNIQEFLRDIEIDYGQYSILEIESSRQKSQ